MALLEVTGLGVAFGSEAAVEDVSFTVGRGERFGIIGESGSGKSVTAFAIAGLLPEEARRSGSIRFDGAPLPGSESDMARLRGKHIGMVFQEPMTALNPLMKAGAQIAEAIRLGRPGIEVGGAVDRLLKEVGLEAAHADRYPHELSGGQRQRVLIAMALASEPELLIADEPTSALDVITQRRLLDLIAEICDRRRMALIFISHDLRAVAALCSEVLVLKGGRVVERGPAGPVFLRPRQPYTRDLVAASRPMPGPAMKGSSGPEILSVSGLVRHYRRKVFGLVRPPEHLAAVDDVTFGVEQGEAVAIVGPSGSGKTTLARMIAGLDRASGGVIRFEREKYGTRGMPRSLRHEVSLVFQDPFGSFNPRLTVADSVGEPLLRDRSVSPIERGERVAQALEAVGLRRDMLVRYPHEFSGGQRQRLAIARALVTRPKLVILDEPVSALDVSVRGEVLKLLNRLRQEFGLTYLIISHDLDMVATVSDRVMVMDRGKIVETGTPQDIFSAPQHRLTQELIAARLPDVTQEVPAGS